MSGVCQTNSVSRKVDVWYPSTYISYNNNVSKIKEINICTHIYRKCRVKVNLKIYNFRLVNISEGLITLRQGTVWDLIDICYGILSSIIHISGYLRSCLFIPSSVIKLYHTPLVSHIFFDLYLQKCCWWSISTSIKSLIALNLVISVRKFFYRKWS